MYIFGVFECVFSVVAVGSQPILCKGLKQTIIQWQWIRRTEEATRIDDIIKHHTLSSEAIIYSADYSSAFNFCWPFNYFIKLNCPSVLAFMSYTMLLNATLAVWCISLTVTARVMAAVLLWRACWRVSSFEWTHCRTGHIVLCDESHFFKI